MTMQTPDQPQAAEAITKILVTSRDYHEYLAMFGLSEEDCRTYRFLDCPGGASDFGAQVRRRGGQAVSVDPVYDLSPDELQEHVLSELDRGIQRAADVPFLYDFAWTGGLDGYLARRREAAETFLADYTRHAAHKASPHYVTAALPDLPFLSGTFDIAVVPNLLFCYANHFDVAWHRQAVRELLRVARQVRIHPLTESTGTPYGQLDELIGLLSEDGIHCSVVDVEYRLHPGPSRTLHCARARA
jgi:hypothetical protein